MAEAGPPLVSVRVSQRVWEESQHGGTELLMLLAIADFANDGGEAWPSVGTLAKKLRVTPRHAKNLLKTLRDSGELIVFQRSEARITRG